MKESRRVFAVILCLFIAVMMVGTAYAQKAPEGPIILKGAPMGGVKFLHSQHKMACVTCHHASKPEKPAKSLYQPCTDCHTKVAAPPMKTKLQAAFHNPTATSGICIDCHKKEAAAGKPAPTKCAQCHQKANG
jgi:nitrate/TMAO reductase-like tetraheme cytochrome c subunit